MPSVPAHASPLARLRRLGVPPAKAPPTPQEQCDLCGAPVDAMHPHLLEMRPPQHASADLPAPRRARLICTCRPCALLFANRASNAACLPVPEDVIRLPDFNLSDDLWRSLLIPIELAFLVRRDDAVAACYPSPAGATEAAVHPDAWHALVERNPVLNELRPHVEALLVNRMFGQHLHYRAPIDLCYQLVGIVRVHWRGLSGGTEVWKQVQSYFADLQTRARPLPGPASAGAAHA